MVRQLIAKSPLNTLNYRYLHSDSGDPRGIDVALIYREDRVRIVESSFIKPIYKGDTLTTRDILYSKVVLRDSDTLNLFVVHLPSKYGGKIASNRKREMCVKIIRSYTDSIIKRGEPLLIMGDFNDVPSEIDSFFRDNEIKYINHFAKYDDFENGVKGSVKFMNKWQIIDQFISCGRCRGKAKIYAPKFLLEHDTKYLGVKPFRTYSGPRHLGGVSDHLPIVFRIE